MRLDGGRCFKTNLGDCLQYFRGKTKVFETFSRVGRLRSIRIPGVLFRSFDSFRCGRIFQRMHSFSLFGYDTLRSFLRIRRNDAIRLFNAAGGAIGNAHCPTTLRHQSAQSELGTQQRHSMSPGKTKSYLRYMCPAEQLVHKSVANHTLLCA